jgi:hypothetical protein
MAYPKVVAFDLESVSSYPSSPASQPAYIVSSGTIWSNWLDPNAFGRWGWVGTALEDNLEIYGNEIRDNWLVHALFL